MNSLFKSLLLQILQIAIFCFYTKNTLAFAPLSHQRNDFARLSTKISNSFSSCDATLKDENISACNPTSRGDKNTPSSAANDSLNEKAAKEVTAEELEIMLTEWDQPLVIDAFADWCGPCQMMSPEYEAAAQELQNQVRFVKLDTDKEEAMANRLNVQGLPTILFLGKSEDDSGVGSLKERVEGALKKESIVDLCRHHFFGENRPDKLLAA